jgi:hypothetical protein
LTAKNSFSILLKRKNDSVESMHQPQPPIERQPCGVTEVPIGAFVLPPISEIAPNNFYQYYYPYQFFYGYVPQLNTINLQEPQQIHQSASRNDNVILANEIQLRPSESKEEKVEVTVNDNVVYVPNSNVPESQSQNFIMATHIYKGQRKSYKSEKRYILPSPIEINKRANSPIHQFTVIAYLYSADLLTEYDYGTYYEVANTRKYTACGNSPASFQIKVLKNSPIGMDYRLLFRINWQDSMGRNRMEKIASKPFSVKSSKALKKEKESSSIDINPKACPAQVPTEIWIHGNFRGKGNPTIFLDKQEISPFYRDDSIIKILSLPRQDNQRQGSFNGNYRPSYGNTSHIHQRFSIYLLTLLNRINKLIYI